MDFDFFGDGRKSLPHPPSTGSLSLVIFPAKLAGPTFPFQNLWFLVSGFLLVAVLDYKI